MERTQCQRCQQSFQHYPEDLQYYAALNIPAPSLCPSCRQWQRLVFRNDRHYYQRQCNLCQQVIISIYAPDKPYPVYCQTCFWSDAWDPRTYGRDFDFSRPFFEQYAEMRALVPRIAIFNTLSENSAYTVHSGKNKNCYLSASLVECENTHYSDWAFYCKDSLDLYLCQNMELCYFCYESLDCYSSGYLINCAKVNFSMWCFDCRGSEYLLGCVGLRNQRYQILNKTVSPEQYHITYKQIAEDVHFRQQFIEQYQVLRHTVPKPATWMNYSDESSGNYITNSHNAKDCYHVKDLEHVRYGYDIGGVKDSYDAFRCANGERLYFVNGTIELTNSMCCNLCYHSSFMEYSDNCQQSHYGFGCMSLKNNRYCILNQQYSSDAYQSLRQKIVQHMQHTGEWGKFFPVELSLFNYSETKANDFYPESQPVEKQSSSVAQSTTASLLPCQRCAKLYKIIPAEREIYARLHLPLPVHCLDCRIQERLSWEEPRQLHDSNCMKCHANILTVYTKDDGVVYCQHCYKNTIY